MKCVFCDINNRKKIRETENTFTILSNPYLLKGHLLVIPKKHFESILEIPDKILFEMIREIKEVEKLLIEKFKASGVDIRQNYRPFQKENKLKVHHIHFHLIPREFEDELYKKSMIFEKDVFRDLNEKTEMEVLGRLK
jgi:histidine triad (HIT) family protein